MELGRKPILHGAKVGVACALLAGKYKEIVRTTNEPAFQVYHALPEQAQLSAWLGQAGGPTTPEELGISPEMVERAFTTAHTLRDRYTGLKYMNEVLCSK